jgi:hypothetical protein
VQLTIRIDLGEGPLDVTTSLFTIVEWERKMRTKISRIQEDGLGAEDLLFMAFTQLKVEKTVTLPPSFDDFCKRVIALDVINDEADPRPTEAATVTPFA